MNSILFAVNINVPKYWNVEAITVMFLKLIKSLKYRICVIIKADISKASEKDGKGEGSG